MDGYNASGSADHPFSQIAIFVTSTSAIDVTLTAAPVIEWRHPFWWIVFFLVCLVTTAGNCLVVAAVCTKKYLRNPTGYLIISLAIADLIVGIAVMPLNSLLMMTNHVWLIGLPMCDIWHALDIFACNASIWSLCVISIDRYLGLQDPIGYRDRVSKKRILIAICGVWLMSAFLSFPAIWIWRLDESIYVDPYKCDFTQNKYYVWGSSIVTFWIPLGIILWTYGNVFLIASRHSRSLKSGMKKNSSKKKDSESAMSDDQQQTLRIHFGRPERKLSKSLRQPNRVPNAAGSATTRMLLKQVSCRSLAEAGNREATPSTPLLRPPPSSASMNTFGMLRPARTPVVRTYSNTAGRSDSSEDAARSSSDQAMMTTTFDGNGNTTTLHSPTPVHKASGTSNGTSRAPTPVKEKRKMNVREKSRRMLRYVHEQRAARTLSIVVGAFILCWLPFFVFSPFDVVCKDCVSSAATLFNIFTWTGHLNSMLNPLIYSRFSRDFRRAFKQLLTCQRERKARTIVNFNSQSSDVSCE